MNIPRAVLRTLFMDLSLDSLFTKLCRNFWKHTPEGDLVHWKDLKEGMRLSRISFFTHGIKFDLALNYYDCTINQIASYPERQIKWISFGYEYKTSWDSIFNPEGRQEGGGGRSLKFNYDGTDVNTENAIMLPCKPEDWEFVL